MLLFKLHDQKVVLKHNMKPSKLTLQT